MATRPTAPMLGTRDRERFAGMPCDEVPRRRRKALARRQARRREAREWQRGLAVRVA